MTMTIIVIIIDTPLLTTLPAFVVVDDNSGPNVHFSFLCFIYFLNSYFFYSMTLMMMMMMSHHCHSLQASTTIHLTRKCESGVVHYLTAHPPRSLTPSLGWGFIFFPSHPQPVTHPVCSQMWVLGGVHFPSNGHPTSLACKCEPGVSFFVRRQSPTMSHPLTCKCKLGVGFCFFILHQQVTMTCWCFFVLLFLCVQDTSKSSLVFFFVSSFRPTSASEFISFLCCSCTSELSQLTGVYIMYFCLYVHFILSFLNLSNWFFVCDIRGVWLCVS